MMFEDVTSIVDVEESWLSKGPRRALANLPLLCMIDLHQNSAERNYMPCLPLGSFHKVNCRGKCNGRCSKAGVSDRCMKYCGICCQKCKCVPSGTYGNKHQCPCYRDMVSSKGKPKCP